MPGNANNTLNVLPNIQSLANITEIRSLDSREEKKEPSTVVIDDSPDTESETKSPENKKRNLRKLKDARKPKKGKAFAKDIKDADEDDVLKDCQRTSNSGRLASLRNQVKFPLTLDTDDIDLPDKGNNTSDDESKKRNVSKVHSTSKASRMSEKDRMEIELSDDSDCSITSYRELKLKKGRDMLEKKKKGNHTSELHESSDHEVEASKKSAVTKANSKASRPSEKERMEIELSDVHESSITGKPKRDKRKRTEMLENEKKKKRQSEPIFRQSGGDNQSWVPTDILPVATFFKEEFRNLTTEGERMKLKKKIFWILT